MPRTSLFMKVQFEGGRKLFSNKACSAKNAGQLTHHIIRDIQNKKNERSIRPFIVLLFYAEYNHFKYNLF